MLQKKTLMKTIVVTLCLLFLLKASKFLGSEKELSDEEFHKLVRTTFFYHSGFHVVARECPERNSKKGCLYVLDRMGYDEKGWFVGRMLSADIDAKNGFLSVSQLRKPQYLTASAINTAQWNVDIGVVDAITPNAAEFAWMFKSGHFALDTELHGDILFLGVGTGALMSYVANHFKNIKLTGIDPNSMSKRISAKWFGYDVSNKMSNIIVGNGEEYIRRMAKNNETSDAVLIDACHNTPPEDGIFCPVQAIRSPEFFGNLSKVLANRGIALFNLYVIDDTGRDYLQILKDALKHFHRCSLIDGDKLVKNKFLMCSNQETEPHAVNMQEADRFVEKLGFIRFMQYMMF